MKPRRHLGLVGVAAVAVLRGCDCSDDRVATIEPWSCELMEGRPGPGDVACPEGEAFDKGVCAPLRCDARGEPRLLQCCPGEICLGDGSCEVPLSRITTCEADGECDSGTRCLSRPLIYDPAGCQGARTQSDCEALNNPDAQCTWAAGSCQPLAKTCGFEPVNAAGQCENGGRAWGDRCVDPVEPPCGGSCPAGAVCNIDTNLCEEPPALPEGHGCDGSCGLAEILVYTDPDTMLWSQCCAVTCECLTLPPLAFGTWGRYADLAVDAGAVYVSAYDTTYGDLVLGTHGRISGQLETLTYVDGVPESDDVAADPVGPRGGTAVPGPDVGTHTAMALHQDSVNIAYYDRDTHDLRFASNRSGEWVTGIIDDGRDTAGANTGDVGQFADLVIDDAGIAHVTYYAHRVDIDGTLVTGPKYARALTSEPLVYEDWERFFIESLPSCEESCAGGELCVLDAGAATCANPRVDCGAACACDESCVDLDESAVCRRILPGSLEEPCDGSCPSGSSCVADVPSGTVCLEDSSPCSGCADDEVCVNTGGANVCRRATPYSSISGLPNGVGLFTSLAIYENRPTVVYYDRFLRQLRGAVAEFLYDDDAVTDFTAGVLPVGCDTGSDNGRFASLAVAPGGASLGVAYQADAGSSLWLYRGSSLFSGSTELVDDGLAAGGVDLVGGSASLAFGDSPDEPFIAYADQTENDLLLAYQTDDGWQIAPQLTDGACGSFARIAIDGRTAWLSTYLRARDRRNRDTSRIVIAIVDLDQLTP